MTTINKRDFPYLKESEIKSFSENITAETLQNAKNLNNLRFTQEQDQLTAEFVENAEKTHTDKIRNKVVSDGEELMRYVASAGGNELAGLDMFLYNRADYRNEINALLKGVSDRPIGYLSSAAKAGSNSLKRYLENEELAGKRAGAITTADNPGIANTIDVTVSQNIAYRAENQGRIMPLIDKVNLPFGNYDEPYYNKYSIAGYLTETGTVPEIDADLKDATNGIKKNQWVVKDFALGLFQSFNRIYD